MKQHHASRNKFRQLHFRQVLFKFVFISHCYHESHKGEFFLKHSAHEVYEHDVLCLLVNVNVTQYMPQNVKNINFVPIRCVLSSSKYTKTRFRSVLPPPTGAPPDYMTLCTTPLKYAVDGMYHDVG